MAKEILPIPNPVGKLVKPAGASLLRLLVGWLLFLLPAFFCIFSLLIPTLRTLHTSLLKTGLPGQAAQFIGMKNYSALFDNMAFQRAFIFTALLILVRLVIVAVLPPLLGFAAARSGRGTRSLLRLLMSVPIVVFAPVTAGLLWRMMLSPASQIVRSSPLARASAAAPVTLIIDSLYFTGLACGIGLIFYLAAMQTEEGNSGPGIRRALPAIALWVVSLLATISLSLQDFSLSYTLTAGGPANTTTTLALLEYKQAFQFMDFGSGASLASLMLLALFLCGAIAGCVIVFSRLRLSIRRPRLHTPGAFPVLAALLLALSLLYILPVCAISLLPIPWAAFIGLRPAVAESFLSALNLGQILGNTFLPLLILAFLIQLPVALLGGLGIGALRPLGKWSELLLLPFSPWLFVTIIPLSITNLIRLSEAGGLNKPFSLAPPLWLNVPMLIVLSLFFAEQEEIWRNAAGEGRSGVSTFFRHMILPSLPLAMLLGLTDVFFGAQDLLWPLVAASNPQLSTLTVMLIRLQGQYASAGPLLAGMLIRLALPGMAISYLLFAIFQVTYLDKLALKVQDK